MLVYYYGISMIFLGSCFFVSKQHIVTTEKQLSWVLTFTSSLICSFCSLPNLYHFWQSGYDMHWLTLNTQQDIALVCFFQVYLAMDLGLGRRYYRQRINWVTGYLHHSVYLVLLTWFLKCRIPSFFVAASVLEVPTLILALGSIHPPWRSDRLFAFTFFCLRLVLHTVMIRLLKHHHHVRSLWCIALAILPLHLYWFYGIIHLQARKYRHKHNTTTITLLTSLKSQPTSTISIPSEAIQEVCFLVK
ncbi:uncharacterized protein BX664DRAFT_275960 [Halteromyces radiatus]|uniref:uncharacterized protein n=1 Tax=Halteromyces radiatus TaxID=101107 RepID=UPI00221EDE4A|nr:uncharacterized protein BX664DRAFT_275960 [Halteromyces radiatus]KAI8097306.1 hypothetical protein BX664DRAFT_275960 [Halteromyces radiatus]